MPAKFPKNLRAIATSPYKRAFYDILLDHEGMLEYDAYSVYMPVTFRAVVTMS